MQLKYTNTEVGYSFSRKKEKRNARLGAILKPFLCNNELCALPNSTWLNN